MLAAVLATSSYWVRANSCGHDFDFHLVSWIDTLDGWRHGVLYPHWSPSSNFGAGEPRFVFYPPLTWMAGAILGAFLPWRFVPFAMTLLLLAATGMATRALARQVLPEGQATLAGCAAMFSGYALFTAFERSAFAELTGGFWIPLMLLLVLQERHAVGAAGERVGLIRRMLDGSALPLALVVAGAWLSNAPVGVMASYLLAGFALAVAVVSKSWAPVGRAAIGAGLGLGLSAFYLVPAAWEQRWIAIRQAVDDPGLLIENSWLFARHANVQLGDHDVELFKVSMIAVSMVAVALVSLLVLWLRGRLPGGRRWWVPMTLIPVVVLLLQLPVSLPVWNALPKLRFLQFPWRWLVAVEAPMAIFFASAVWMETRWRKVVVLAVCGVVFAGASAAAGLIFFQQCDVDDSVTGTMESYRTGAGFEGTDEYAPPGADDSLVAAGLPGGCLVSDPKKMLGEGDSDMTPMWTEAQGSCDAAFAFSSVEKATAEHLRMHAVNPHAGYLILRLRRYPAWDIRVNGRPATSLPSRKDGLMAVAVPQGPVDLTVDWTTTRDEVLGRWISVIALGFVTGLWLVERRVSRGQLS